MSHAFVAAQRFCVGWALGFASSRGLSWGYLLDCVFFFPHPVKPLSCANLIGAAKPNPEDKIVTKWQSLTKTTLNNGYLGSRNDEERSEMRYVV
jgi:hypothetical protein